MRFAEFLDLPVTDLDTRGGRVTMVDAGDGPAVLLLHGNPTWSFQWRDVIESLTADHRVVAPDLPGFGRSERLATYTWEGFLAAVEDVARWLGPATVVGHDWGGALGVHLALRFPNLVRHLVLMEPQVFPETWDDYPGERGERFRRLRDPVSGTDLILRRNLMVEQISDGVCRQLDEDELDGYRYPYPTPESRRAIQRLVQMKPIGPGSETYAFFTDLESRLPSVSVPLTVLVVEGGPLLPPSRSARLERAVRDAHVVHLGEGRHHFHEDHAALVAQIVRDLNERSA